MTFPWLTKQQIRDREAGRQIEADAKAKYSREYAEIIASINRATDKEIDAAMAEIHKRQLDRDRIKPVRDKYDPGVGALLRKIRGDA